jgi:phosphoesterase RecJ-like protein
MIYEENIRHHLTSLKEIASVLKSSGNIAILPHVSADGDAVGSCLALALALKGMGKKVKVCFEEAIPNNYAFLPGTDLAEVYRDKPEEHYELVVSLDSGDLGRLGKRIEIFNRGENTVNIDHHGTNEGYARYNIVDTSFAAVGEIIYFLIECMGIEINLDMAICLYVAISTDTGGFRYSNTTSLTHMIISNLLKTGADVAEISQRIFDSTSLQKVKLMGIVADSLQLEENGRVAIIKVTREDFERSGALDEDFEGLVNIGTNVEGVEVAALLRENGKNEVKVNLRSASSFDVSEIAVPNGGGGHRKAAGYTSAESLDKTCEKLLKDIRDRL